MNWFADSSPSVPATGSINRNAMESGTSMTNRDIVPRDLPPLDAFTAVVERPLFASTRRPPPKIESSEASMEPALLFRGHFVGSIETSDGLRALFSNGGKLQSVALGEEIQGWTAIEMNRRRLLLTSDNRVIEFMLFR